jgi:hypothetical protein
MADQYSLAWISQIRHTDLQNSAPFRVLSPGKQRTGGIEMIDIRRPDGTPWFADKTAIQKIVAEQNERIGFVPDPEATPERVRAMMLALGIRPEDNMASCGIIAAREE